MYLGITITMVCRGRRLFLTSRLARPDNRKWNLRPFFGDREKQLTQTYVTVNNTKEYIVFLRPEKVGGEYPICRRMSIGTSLEGGGSLRGGWDRRTLPRFQLSYKLAFDILSMASLCTAFIVVPDRQNTSTYVPSSESVPALSCRAHLPPTCVTPDSALHE